MSHITAFVRGKPQSQGSKSVGKHGQLYEPKQLAVWRDAVKMEVLVFMRKLNMAPLEGPVEVMMEFSFLRPDSHHPMKGGERDTTRLRKSAPRYHVYKPDLDKLIRAVLDALTGTAYDDDRQVVHIFADKTWCSHPDLEGVNIVVVEQPIVVDPVGQVGC